MRKTVTTFCILTLLPWKNVVTGLRCSVTTIYRIICYGILVLKFGVSSYDDDNNDDKLIKLHSNFNFEAFLLLVL